MPVDKVDLVVMSKMFEFELSSQLTISSSICQSMGQQIVMR
jgi:hypothetical protein